MGVEPSPFAITVAIADGETLFRRGVAELIGSDRRVGIVGQAADGEQAMLLCSHLRPDVVVLSARLRGMSCLDASARIVRISPKTRVIVLAGLESEALILAAVEAGASGYVLRDCEPAGLVASVVAVAEGRRIYCGTGAATVRELRLPSDHADLHAPRVGARDSMLLMMIADGASNREIAATLRVSDKTIRNRVSQLYQKLGLRDRSDAFAYAQLSGTGGRP